MAKGYWIAHVDVADPDAYKAYLEANAKPFAKYGARFLVRAGQATQKEGALRSRHVVIAFKDYATALACYEFAGVPKRLRAAPTAGGAGRPRHYRGLRRKAAGLRARIMESAMVDMRLIVTGAAGRMGRMLIKAIAETPGVTLAAAIERKGALAIGADAGLIAGAGASGIMISDDPLPATLKADGIVDFSAPAASVEMAALAAQARIAHVVGTTGLTEADLERIAAAARHAPIVRSGNMSLGVNLLARLVRDAARALGPDYDVEVVEMHHRMKVDAPSGTALMLGQAAADGRAIDLKGHSERGRDGVTGPRKPGAIGFASLRGGTVVGDHSVIFAGDGERIVLSHHAEDRSLFARGALKAALWAHGRKPGLYSMADVLGFGEA